MMSLGYPLPAYMGGNGFCLGAVLNCEIAYVGPVEFHILLQGNTPVKNFPGSFRHAAQGAENASATVYDVRVSSLGANKATGDPLLCGAAGRKVFENEEFAEYVDREIVTRLHFGRIQGERTAFLKAVLDENRIELYVPDEEHWPPGRRREIWTYLMMEKLLMKENAVILHSASVVWDGGAILFTAPSETGKSTQADLWKKYTGAVGLNGDRNILMKRDGKWIVCGLPWCGTSPDCLNEAHPLGAIAVVRQAEKNMVSKLSAAEKILHISEGITMNRWDRAFTEKAFDLAILLAKETMIVQLDCTMERSAVDCLKDRIRKGNPNENF